MLKMTASELACSFKQTVFVQKCILNAAFFFYLGNTMNVEDCCLLVLFNCAGRFSDNSCEKQLPLVPAIEFRGLMQLSFSHFILFSVCLFILYSALPSIAGTGCFILTKHCSKQVLRGGRDLFLL